MGTFVDSYLDWLKKNMKETVMDNGLIEITTPFLDMNNDYTQFYIENKNGLYKITDAGYTIDNLAMAGMDVFSSDRRLKILNLFLNRLGLKVDKETREIYTEIPEADKNSIYLKGHCLLQGMLDINDMFALVSPNTVSFFNEEVNSFFKERKIFNTKNISYIGKSGLLHQYDFLLQENDKNPGRLVRLMNQPKRETFERYAFEWHDIQDQIQANDDVKKCIVLINDFGKIDSKKIQAIVSGFDAYNIETSFWSRREEELPEFA